MLTRYANEGKIRSHQYVFPPLKKNRPPPGRKVTPEMVEKMKDLESKGYTRPQIAEACGVSDYTVCRRLGRRA